MERCLHRLVHVPALGVLVLFGGQTTGTAYLGDSWLYELKDRVWREHRGRAPSPRNFYGAAATEDTLYLVGGSAEGGSLGDLWAFDGKWKEVRTSRKGPAPRNGHDVTVMGDRLLLFGGTGSSGELSDLWELSLP